LADTDQQVLAGLFDINPATEVALIEDDTAPVRSYPPMMLGEVGRAQIVSWDPHRVEIEVESPHPGVVILHDLYYPGWSVEIDSQPARMLRANILFRGVEVAEGSHRVVFRFAPFSVANLREAVFGLVQPPR
jgi:uncharacterized membrane protein YfhO